MRMHALAALLSAAALLGGCANQTKPLYHWENYQRQVYEAMKGDGTSPNEQFTALKAQADRARAGGLALPPGFRAHMGFVLLRMGQGDDARAQFEAEKAAFPESTQYMEDRKSTRLNSSH